MATAKQREAANRADFPEDHPSYMTAKQQQEAIKKHIGAGQALPSAAGSELSLYAEMQDLAQRCEERAKALEATLEDECDGSEKTRYRWKIKAGMFRSIGIEVKQRIRSWEIHR
tara:strand:- start:25 stop:366 length:342 start_codon:yes stop_codon:yes gene_type:complete